MRIVHWTESFWPRIGGAEHFVRLLAADLFRHGHECVVISDVASGLPSHDRIDGLAIRRFPFQSALARRDLPEIVALASESTAALRDLAPAVLHLHTSQPGAFFFLRARKSVPIPTVFTTHDPLTADGNAQPLLVQVLETASRVAAVSSFMAQRVRDAFPAVAPRVCCIPNGLPSPAEDCAPLPWDPPVVLAVSRLTDEKGIDVLLRAIPQVGMRGIRVVIAGDGPALDDLRRLAAALNLEATIEFAGWVSPDAVHRLMNRATVVAVPSRWDEPFGLVALEAMQMARPVVASRVGGLPGIVEDGRTGRLVPPDDPLALAAALTEVLVDSERARAMGEHGRRVAAAAFDWSRCVDAYESLYREIAA